MEENTVFVDRLLRRLAKSERGGVIPFQVFPVPEKVPFSLSGTTVQGQELRVRLESVLSATHRGQVSGRRVEKTGGDPKKNEGSPMLSIKENFSPTKPALLSDSIQGQEKHKELDARVDGFALGQDLQWFKRKKGK